MLRVAKYREMADILEPKYADNRISQVPELKEKLIRIGYKFENNRLTKTKKLKQKLEEVSGKRIA